MRRATLSFARNTIFLFVSITYFSSCINLSTNKKDTKELNLKGKVKSCMETHYYDFSCITEGKKVILDNGLKFSSKDLNVEYTWEFNTDGNILEKSIRKPKDNSTELETNEFDMMGRLKQKNCKFTSGETSIIKYNHFTLSKLLKSEECLNTYSVSYKYDDKENVVEEFSKEMGGKTQINYTYDNHGWILSKTVVGGRKTKFELNADGSPYIITEFDKDGKEVERSEFHNDLLKKRIITQTIEYYNFNGDLETRERYEDEDRKNLTLTEVYFYMYDGKGNWVTRIFCEDRGWNFRPVELTNREIKYYSN